MTRDPAYRAKRSRLIGELRDQVAELVELSESRKRTRPTNIQARARALTEVRLSEEQEGLLKMSDARSIPSTSVQKIRDGRSEMKVPDPTRRPDESDLEYYTRIRRQIEALAQPVGASNDKARPVDSANDGDSFAEAKARLLASEAARVRELTRHQGRVPAAPSTDALTDKAHALMKSRRQSIDPKKLIASLARI
jgi:hypothetical protein